MKNLGLLVALAMYSFALAELNFKNSERHLPRTLPNAPNGYTPEAGDCPSIRPTVRSAGTGLSGGELAWLETRRNLTLQSLPSFLESLNISGFDARGYAQANFGNISNAPNIGLAFSGGGLRATLTGAGAFQAFDAREGGNDPSGLGGLLDSATYIAGLSGGGWLVGSLFANNFSTITSLLDSGSSSPSHDLWNFNNPLYYGPNSSVAGVTDYWTTLHEEVEEKEDAGYNISFTDYWGRALAYQFVNASDGGPSYTWSSIRNDSSFAEGKTPFPLLVADSQIAHQLSFSPTNTTCFEFSPFELGSWDPTNYGFVDLEYLGSNFSDGSLPGDQQCVRGFDNVGFTMGTTSSILSSLVVTGLVGALPSSVQTLLGAVVNETKVDNGLVSLYEPNPFKGWNVTGHALDANEQSLVLVDGGTDLQNLPLQPLIQPARAVDVIVAVDSSADIHTWPNGSSLIATYERSLNASGIANGTAFPSIPDPNTFVNLGLNQRATFFGCNASNSSSPIPLIIYLPNAPYSTYSNISTFTLDINMTQRDAIVANGHQVATMGNGTVNKQFRTCLGCAILSRSFDRTGTTVPQACSACFEAFCWNGTLNTTTPAPYYPVMGSLATVNVTSTSGSSNGSSGGSGGGNSQGTAATNVPGSLGIRASIFMASLIAFYGF